MADSAFIVMTIPDQVEVSRAMRSDQMHRAMASTGKDHYWARCPVMYSKLRTNDRPPIDLWGPPLVHPPPQIESTWTGPRSQTASWPAGVGSYLILSCQALRTNHGHLLSDSGSALDALGLCGACEPVLLPPAAATPPLPGC